jgi:tRNA-Thr(GGU) m(6)t(6)A37 methyltransferase TsaA
MTHFTIAPIAIVRGGRDQPIDDDWGKSEARLELADGVPEESLASLDQFSHAEVIFLFDRVGDAEIVHGARHPRGNTAWPLVGIFAQRGKNRPNRLGVCVCEIVKVEGRNVYVRGLDAIDATPIIDIKPVMQEFLPRGPIRQPDWSRELMKNYW